MINNCTVLKDAADVARSKNNSRAPFALDIVHHLPGRLRLRSASLKGDARAIECRRRQLADIGGVISAEANPGTGSFLLKYDPTMIPLDKIAEAFAVHGIQIAQAMPDREREPASGEAMLSVLKRLVLEVLAERVMLAIVGVAL